MLSVLLLQNDWQKKTIILNAGFVVLLCLVKIEECGKVCDMQLLRYSGAKLVMILWMWRHNLNWIRWGIGSQWSSRRRGVVGVVRPTLKTSCKNHVPYIDNKFKTNLSGRWVSRGNYGVYLAVMGSAWGLRDLRGSYGLYVPLFYATLTGRLYAKV